MFQDGEYIDSYRRAVQSRLLSFCEAKYLPCDVETSVDVRQLYAAAASRIFKSNNPRIIIVMKSFFNAAATAIMMSRFGCKAVICRSGREAYRNYLRHGSKNFHLAIVQWDLDDIGGRDLVHYERERGGDLVFLAAVPERMAADEVIRSGADLFLRMPLCIHMHVLRGLLLPNLQSSYAFPVSAMKLRPNHQVLKTLLEALAAHTTMDEETEQVVREANQLLYSTQDAVLDANLTEFNSLLGKLKKVVEATQQQQQQQQDDEGRKLLLSSGSSSTKNAGTKKTPLSPHPLRAISSGFGGGDRADQAMERQENENRRLASAFSAALKTFNEMKTEITQLMIHRQQLKRLLSKKPEITDVVSPFDPGAAIGAMDRPELCRVISQLRHHVANLLVENEQLTDDYERLCHFKVEFEEDLNSSGVGVVFHDVENVTVSSSDHVTNYAEHALKLLMSGDDSITEEEKEDLRRAASQIKLRRKSPVGQRRSSKDGRRFSVTPGDNSKKVSFREHRNSLFGDHSYSSGMLSLDGGGARKTDDIGNPSPTTASAQQRQVLSLTALTKANVGLRQQLLGANGDDENFADDDETANERAKIHAVSLHQAHEELAVTRRALTSYEKASMFTHDKYLQTVNKVKPSIPGKVPFYLDPIKKSTAPHDVAFDSSVEFVQKVLDMSHSFVERAVTVTPSLFMRAEEFMRALNKALSEIDLKEHRDKVDEYIRDRNIRERTALTEGFNQLKLVREQLAKERNLPVSDLVLIRKAEVLRRQAARALARQLQANQTWHCFRAWGLWARNQKLHKLEHSQVLELQAFQVVAQKESNQLRVNLESERKEHRLLAVENAKNLSILSELTKEVEKLRAQDILKDRTIARLNEKLLTAMAVVAKDGSAEQLRMLTVGRERTEIGVQTDADVDAAVSLAVMQQAEREKQKRARSSNTPNTVAVQCTLLSDETLEKTIDYAIREFIKATKNMWVTPEHIQERGETRAATREPSISTAACADDDGGEERSGEKKQNGDNDKSNKEDGDEGKESTWEISTPTTTEQNDENTTTQQQKQQQQQQQQQQPPSAALAQVKSKAQYHWGMIFNQTEMRRIMKQVAQQAISQMAPATAALNEERDKLSASQQQQQQHRPRERQRPHGRSGQRRITVASSKTASCDQSSSSPSLSASIVVAAAAAGGGVNSSRRRLNRERDHENNDDDDAETSSWAMTSTPIGTRMSEFEERKITVETAEIGIVTDEHGLADAIASPEEIAAAHSGISRRKIQQQKEAARFPTITEAAKSVNELQRFSKVMRDVFGVDMHFYFETANPTTLEVVREVIRSVMASRSAIGRGEYSMSPGVFSSATFVGAGGMRTSPLSRSTIGGIGSGGNSNNTNNNNNNSGGPVPFYQRLYYNNNNNRSSNINNFFNLNASAASVTEPLPAGVRLDPASRFGGMTTTTTMMMAMNDRNSSSSAVVDATGNVNSILNTPQSISPTKMQAQSLRFPPQFQNRSKLEQERLLYELLLGQNQRQNPHQPNTATSGNFSPQPPPPRQQQSEVRSGRRATSLISFNQVPDFSSNPQQQQQGQQQQLTVTPTPASNVISYGRRQSQQQQQVSASVISPINSPRPAAASTLSTAPSSTSTNQPKSAQRISPTQQQQQQQSVRSLPLPTFLPVVGGGTTTNQVTTTNNTTTATSLASMSTSSSARQPQGGANATNGFTGSGLFAASSLLQNMSSMMTRGSAAPAPVAASTSRINNRPTAMGLERSTNVTAATNLNNSSRVQRQTVDNDVLRRALTGK